MISTSLFMDNRATLFILNAGNENEVDLED